MSAITPIYLGVNIDHCATVREARGTTYPDPVQMALAAETAGADGITVHLREDQRHIKERDVEVLQKVLQTRMNLEMAPTDAMFDYALRMKPKHCCLVPEKREELTTEGGLNVIANEKSLTKGVAALSSAGIQVSLFIDAELDTIEASVRCGAQAVEIHTGHYADAQTDDEQDKEFEKIFMAVQAAHKAGLIVNAGHGLHYQNVQRIAQIKEIYELNIGHSMMARAMLTGIDESVRTMKRIMHESRMSDLKK